MKTDDGIKYKYLKPTATMTKSKIRTFGLLTPSLADAISHTDMSLPEVYVSIVKKIIAEMIPQTKNVSMEATVEVEGDQPEEAETTSETGEDNELETEEEILIRLGTPYEQLLLTLWAMHHHEKEMKSPSMDIVQDDTTEEWAERTKIAELGQQDTNMAPMPSYPQGYPFPPQGGDVNRGAIDAMTKLADSIVVTQEAALAASKSKDDPLLKAWKKLSRLSQNIIILGGVDVDGTIPKEPTEEMLSILSSHNGAEVQTYLMRCMKQNNVKLETGLCTALNKGQFINPDDSYVPINFTAFLTPPQTDDEEDECNQRLLKMAIQEKLSDDDINLLTEMKITIPMNTNDLKHHIKNIAGIAGRCMGQQSMLHVKLQKLWVHIQHKENSYTYQFCQERLFGGCFLDKIDWRMHRFLESCSDGDKDDITIEHINFSSLKEQV
jgi:hypothetical protein